MSVTSQVDGTGAGTIALSLNLGSNATSTHIALDLPPGVGLISSPDAWGCIKTATGAQCEVPGILAGTFDLADNRQATTGNYHLSITSTVDGQQVSGAASGTLATTAETVSAELE